MALPCCPPFAQGGLRRAAAGKTFFAQADTTGKGKESYGSSVTLAPPGARKRSGKSGGRTGPVPGPSYFLCPGGHNRQRQRKLWVQRHADPAWGAKKVGEVRWPDGPSAWAVILSLPRRIQPAKATAQQNQTAKKLSCTAGELFFLCQPHAARIAKQPFPGDGTPHPEQ